jgi:hypothetical protein
MNEESASIELLDGTGSRIGGNTGVTVTMLCPGPTRTGFAEEAGITSSMLFERGRGMAADCLARVSSSDCNGEEF